MRNVRPVIPTILSIILLFKISLLFGFSHFQVDPAIDDLIFNVKFDQAIILAEKAISQSSDPSVKMYLLLKQCEIYSSKNNPEKATEILNEVALKMNFSVKRDEELCFLYFLDMAIVLRESDKYFEAVQWLKKSEFCLKKVNNPNAKDVARLYFLLGKSSYETRDSINAIRYFRKSINVLSENFLPEKMAKLTSLSYLQLAYLFSGNPGMAEQIEVEADSVFQSIVNKNHPSLFNYYLNLSFIFLNYSFNISKAEKALNFASEIANKYCSFSDPNYGLLYSYKAQLAYQEHDSEKALGYFRQAETYLLNNEELIPYMYLFYFDLANTYYFYINDFQKAIVYYRKVIENSNPWLKRAHINSLVLSGYCYLELGDTLMAISSIRKGIKAAETGFLVSDRERIYPYRCLAGFYLNIGQEDMAHKYFQKAYEKSKIYKVGWDLETDIITNLANYHRDKGEIQTSLILYQTAIDKAFKDTSAFASFGLFCDEIELVEVLNNKGYALFQLYGKMNKKVQLLKNALDCQKIAIRLIERRLGYLDNESSEYNWLSVVRTVYNNAVLYSTLLYNLTMDVNYAYMAYQFAEKSRMMIILMASREKKLKKFNGVPDFLIQKEIRLHNNILNLQNQLYRSERLNTISNDQKLLSAKLAKFQLENDQLKSFFETNYPRYFNQKYNCKVIGLQRIQENLSNNQILIEYQLLEKQLVIIAVLKDHITLKLISDNDTGKQIIKKFYNMISQNPNNRDPERPFKEFTQYSHLLYSWLLLPIEKEIENKRLIIIPHNELNLIPFEILISELPNENNFEGYKSLSFLVRNHSVCYGYSGTLLYEEIKPNSGKSVAFFIPNYMIAKYKNNRNVYLNLKGAQNEVRKARKLVGGDLFSGYQASETLFKLKAGNYKILHVASHASIDDEIPTLSALELTPENKAPDDGILYSYEIYQLQLNAQLIVLSGCNTGMGPLKQGEGLLSLSRSFIRSGAHGVAFTLWPQADQAGAEIMISFYKGIKNKKRLDDALRSAKLEYLSNADPAKSHPYFWGSFLISGKTDPIVLNHNSSVITIMLILISAGIGLITYRKFKS